ncbi:MAG: DUF448 domain-containing protein [Myxococcales bacterium]|nr:DUF448 domain-containing protein [Myxococcales bacterium]
MKSSRNKGRPAPRPSPGGSAPRSPPVPTPKATVPMRTCVATRTEHRQTDLLRVFAGPDGTAYVEFTSKRKDSGRGAWVLPTAAAFRLVVAEPKRVARSLKVDNIDTTALLERALALAEARVLDFLSLSARSGRLASGGEGATVAVRAGEAVALLVATDASETSLSDIRGAREIPVFVLPLDKEALGRRIGKGLRSVIALRGGGPAIDLVLWLKRREALSAPVGDSSSSRQPPPSGPFAGQPGTASAEPGRTG